MKFINSKVSKLTIRNTPSIQLDPLRKITQIQPNASPSQKLFDDEPEYFGKYVRGQSVTEHDSGKRSLPKHN
jgi:hypothetical protein